MKRQLIAPIALACALFGASNANADSFAFQGYAQGFETLTATLTGGNAPLAIDDVQAGGVTESINGAASFTSYCINLYEDLNAYATYTTFVITDLTGHVFANANAASDLGKLFAEGNVIGNSTQSAAMQVAIWEIAYESSGVYDVDSGDARFSGGSALTSGALTLANSWLSALGTQTTSATLGVLQSATPPIPQDQVFVTASVPEPETYALLTAGLLCVGFLTRRRVASKAR
jgi:PEP-CTERM motif